MPQMKFLRRIAAPFKRALYKLPPFCYRQPPIPIERWEKEYATGHWDYLRGMNELAHYSVITGYFQHCKSGGSILDIGCGEGILEEKVKPFGYQDYVGIDVSEKAIENATEKQNTHTQFICADATTYTPETSFDVIVFNECLNYFDHPLEIVHRYRPFLKENGIFIVSMWIKPRNLRIWRQLEKAYSIEDEVQVTNRAGTSWWIKILRPAV
ncbi:MAG: class I SAM-dependent methyltransferase [bacterium]|nr:class I SAM-dependent methyltransferase [bacterium]